METRDKDKLNRKIGQSDKSLNEPSSRTSGSVGSSGMEGGSKLDKSSDLGSKDKWSDSGKQSGSSE
jgi:hypothetical protein